MTDGYNVAGRGYRAGWLELRVNERGLCTCKRVVMVLSMLIDGLSGAKQVRNMYPK